MNVCDCVGSSEHKERLFIGAASPRRRPRVYQEPRGIMDVPADRVVPRGVVSHLTHHHHLHLPLAPPDILPEPAFRLALMESGSLCDQRHKPPHDSPPNRTAVPPLENAVHRAVIERNDVSGKINGNRLEWTKIKPLLFGQILQKKIKIKILLCLTWNKVRFDPFELNLSQFLWHLLQHFETISKKKNLQSILTSDLQDGSA